ncbi:hypothetical protein KSS87_018437 [Heliosperma pusillum]|nr:hypothetical protein KSS87_018437 [Heliosperma pusillum]
MTENCEKACIMTRLTLDFATMQKENIPAVSADVTFLSSRFPNYKIGSDNQVLELKDNMKTFSMKEIVAKETAMLLEQQKRLSVRDLAHKFEKGLAAAAKLSEEDKLKEAASLEKHVLLKNLRDALEALRGRVTGKNKDDVETAVSMVEALAVQLAKREGELIHEKEEVKRLANFLKQASEEAKRLVEEERSNARAEIENARAAVQRVEEAIQEHEQMSRVSGEQDYEELIREVQEARRIKMLHQPSKVMDMEYELRALRAQLLEKTTRSVQLQKEVLETYSLPPCWQLDALHFRFWFLQCTRATKSAYAPEPFDVGRFLKVEITHDGHNVTVSSTGPIDPAPGLGSYVEALLRRHDTEFNVVVTQINGVDQQSQSIHVLHVGKMRMKLCKGKTTVAKEYYSTSMQLCGVRGGGNAAAQAVFWQVKSGLSFIVAFESGRDRNAAILLARRFAFDCNITLAGPGDRTPLGT